MNQVSNWYAKIHGLDMRLPGGFEEMTLRIILDANATAYLLAGSSKYIRLWYLFAAFSTEFHFRRSQLSRGNRLRNFIDKGNDLSLGLQIRELPENLTRALPSNIQYYRNIRKNTAEAPYRIRQIRRSR